LKVHRICPFEKGKAVKFVEEISPIGISYFALLYGHVIALIFMNCYAAYACYDKYLLCSSISLVTVTTKITTIPLTHMPSCMNRSSIG